MGLLRAAPLQRMAGRSVAREWTHCTEQSGDLRLRLGLARDPDGLGRSGVGGM